MARTMVGVQGRVPSQHVAVPRAAMTNARGSCSLRQWVLRTTMVCNMEDEDNIQSVRQGEIRERDRLLSSERSHSRSSVQGACTWEALQ